MKPLRVRKAKLGSRLAGGWLITYADLMTILVCFFVLIVSYSIQDQVKMEVVAGSMRDAFGVAEERRYAGDYRLDGTPEERQPGNIRPTPMPSADGLDETLTVLPAAGAEGRNGAFEYEASERKHFEAVKERLERAILTHPIMKDSSEAITINLTEDGLQVLLVDTAGRPMFETGASTPTPAATLLLTEVARALKPLANRIIIEGHADASGAGAYPAFDLTIARANAARRVMAAAGLDDDRIVGVVGRGDAFPLYPENPFAAGNRRIEILLEPAAPLLPAERSL